MKKRWIAMLLVTTLLLALALTGCGKKKDQEETEPWYDEAPVFTEAPVYSEPTEIVWQEDTPATEESAVPAATEETVPPTAAPTEPEEDPHLKKVDETVYAVAKVNVRSGPGFNYKVMGQLRGGDTVRRTGIGDHGWSQIVYEDKTGYVANNYVTTDSPEKANGATFKEVDETVKATAKVNIRSGPGVDYDVIGQLQAGEEVKRTAIGDKGWSRILYNNKPCYVSNSYLRK